MNDHYAYCPECQMIWPDGRRICEINGAGAETILMDPIVGRELIDTTNAFARVLEHAAAALERVQVAEDTTGASDEAQALLEQVVTLEGFYVRPKEGDS